MSDGKKIMVVGMGRIGGLILEFLARIPGVPEIICADKNKDMALGNVYSSQLDIGLGNIYSAQGGAAQQGLYPQIEFVYLDINNVKETAETLRSINPDIIIYCATLSAPAEARKELPKDVFEKLMSEGLGLWLPLHLALTYKFMKAVKVANIASHVVSSAFGDLVNPVLGKIGLAPTVGLGNFDNSVPGIKKIVAERLKVRMQDVSIFMVAHHSIRPIFLHKGMVRGLPYLLRILINGKDVTAQFDTDELMLEGRIAPGLTASSGVKNALAILNDTGLISNAPGPLGLPGGYPVRLSRKGAELALPEGITMEEAIRLNERGQELDGVEGIQEDGTVIFTKRAIKVMKEVLNYDCKEVKIEESEGRAIELKSLYDRLKAKY